MSDRLIDAEEILGFKINIRKVSFRIEPEVSECIDNSNKKLIKIAKEGDELTPDQDIYKLFMENVEQGIDHLLQVFNRTKLVRRLISSLNQTKDGQESSIFNSIYFQDAIEVIKQKLKPSFCSPLFLLLLCEWGQDRRKDKTIYDLIFKEADFQSMPNRLKQVYENKQYFDDSNALTSLCLKAIDEDKDIYDVLELFDLKMLSGAIRFNYFLEFMEMYTAILVKKPILFKKLGNILETLAEQNSLETNKKCLAIIIGHLPLNETNDETRKMLIDFTFAHIGDPAIDHKWLPWHRANPNDKKSLATARKQINTWLAERIISLFFKRITMDEARRAFWSEMINDIRSFKIIMNDKDRTKFLEKFGDEIIEAIRERKIGVFKGNSQSNCLAMEMGDYLFVEFSEKGNACYVYSNLTTHIPNLDENDFSISRLKNSNNRQLIVRSLPFGYKFEKEGRFIHSGEWQYKFKLWMERHL